MVEIRGIDEKDKEWITNLLTDKWGSTNIVSPGKMRDASALPRFIVTVDNKPVGIITYKTGVTNVELLLSIASLREKELVSSYLKLPRMLQKIISVKEFG